MFEQQLEKSCMAEASKQSCEKKEGKSDIGRMRHVVS